MEEVRGSGGKRFSYSIRHNIIGWGIATAIFTPFYLWLVVLFPPPAYLRADAILVLIALLPVYLFIRYLRREVRQADFYDDNFSVRARHLKGTFTYEQIERIGLAPGRGGRISVFLRQGGERLDFFRDPVSKEPKSDLYRWLNDKLPEQSSTS